MIQFLAMIFYFALAFSVIAFSYKKQTSSASFLMGNRSMNPYLTAMAAHASDMSNWLFMAYPATIWIGGLFNAWAAIGLTLCMFLNWQWIAPKLRVLTEKLGSLTLSSFFEKVLGDTKGHFRLASAGICALFYTVYIAGGLVGLGHLAHTLFGIDYSLGITLGGALVIAYIFIGGYTTLAWLDLFQGIFLLLVILIVPTLIFTKLDVPLTSTTSLFPTWTSLTFFQILSMALGWGFGYFGQPHILTKFMGIRDVSKIKQSKRVGMLWMILALTAATFVGLIAVPFFNGTLAQPEMLFVEMVKQTFPPFVIGFILCAIIAAIINVTSSQLLVISSILSEDFYKKFLHKKASGKELVRISRLGMIFVTFFALAIAFFNPASIFQLVLYAWSGLGAAFGPLLVHTLFAKRLSLSGAWVGMLSGAATAALWPLLNLPIEPLLPAFALSLALNVLTTRLVLRKTLTISNYTKS